MKIKIIKKKPSEVVSAGLIRQELDSHGLVLIANSAVLEEAIAKSDNAAKLLPILICTLQALDPEFTEE